MIDTIRQYQVRGNEREAARLARRRRLKPFLPQEGKYALLQLAVAVMASSAILWITGGVVAVNHQFIPSVILCLAGFVLMPTGTRWISAEADRLYNEAERIEAAWLDAERESGSAIEGATSSGS